MMNHDDYYFNTHYLYSCWQHRSFSHTSLLKGRNGKVSPLKVATILLGSLFELAAAVMAVVAMIGFYKRLREGSSSIFLGDPSFSTGIAAVTLFGKSSGAAMGIFKILKRQQVVDALCPVENELENWIKKEPIVKRELSQLFAEPGIVSLIQDYASDLSSVYETFGQFKEITNLEQTLYFDDAAGKQYKDKSLKLKNRILRRWINQGGYYDQVDKLAVAIMLLANKKVRTCYINRFFEDIDKNQTESLQKKVLFVFTLSRQELEATQECVRKILSNDRLCAELDDPVHSQEKYRMQLIIQTFFSRYIDLPTIHPQDKLIRGQYFLASFIPNHSIDEISSQFLRQAFEAITSAKNNETLKQQWIREVATLMSNR